MSNPLTGLLDSTRLLFDLQQGNEIAQSFSGCLDPEEIAHRITEGLVEKFNCAFARLWLLEPDQTMLKLVASSGLYTHTNGSFARVPMGAYKVGKIAQNRVSFLSNNLAAEPWVGNREWAIDNNIRGFAGYPLLVKERVIGVLATFSHHVMEPEFLEVLQTLCTIAAIALDTVSQYHKEKQIWQSSVQSSSFNHLSLSDQIASILRAARLTLVGTEHALSLPVAYIFLRAAELLHRNGCAYSRLIYGETLVTLEAIVPTPNPTIAPANLWMQTVFGELFLMSACLGGVLQCQTQLNPRAAQIVLEIPYLPPVLPAKPEECLQIRCSLSVLQLAFTQLSALAGLTLCPQANEQTPCLTDDICQIQSAKRVLWVHQGTQPLPRGIQARVDLSIRPDQLRQAVIAVSRGETWGIDPTPPTQPTLSEREIEILVLLTQGLRDRDIADRLVISESTVKFHINNVLSKLKVRTRYQAIYQAIKSGWL